MKAIVKFVSPPTVGKIQSDQNRYILANMYPLYDDMNHFFLMCSRNGSLLSNNQIITMSYRLIFKTVLYMFVFVYMNVRHLSPLFKFESFEWAQLLHSNR